MLPAALLGTGSEVKHGPRFSLFFQRHTDNITHVQLAFELPSFHLIIYENCGNQIYFLVNKKVKYWNNIKSNVLKGMGNCNRTPWSTSAAKPNQKVWTVKGCAGSAGWDLRETTTLGVSVNNTEYIKQLIAQLLYLWLKVKGILILIQLLLL